MAKGRYYPKSNFGIAILVYIIIAIVLVALGVYSYPRMEGFLVPGEGNGVCDPNCTNCLVDPNYIVSNASFCSNCQRSCPTNTFIAGDMNPSTFPGVGEMGYPDN